MTRPAAAPNGTRSARLTVFDPLEQDGAPAPVALPGHHFALAHLGSAELFHHTFARLHQHHDHRVAP